GTMGGVSRYDAHRPDREQFVTFTTQDGLAHNQVTSILEDREGNFWFGTWGGGVSRYDGLVFQHLLKRDGLPDDAIQEIFQDRNGAIWIVTQQGITRYRSYHAPPRVRLTDVATDHRYGPLAEIRVPSSQKYLAFEFQGSSLKTPWDRMAYVYRLKGYDVDWRPTRERRVEYADLPRGKYVFQVKAVDRDLAYSETPAEVRVRIHLPYGKIALIGLSAMAMMAAVVASGYAVKRRRERDRARQALLETQAQLVEEMGRELQVAHDMQMDLMPKASPEIPGFDIAGQCLPANRVGGDYFDYIWLDEMHTKLCIVLADVVGSAMKATIPVVMFSGMLHTASEHTSSPADLLNHLNRFLPPRLEPHSFISCCVAHVDVLSQRMVLCNAGQPGPLVRRGEHVHTISMETSHWPLGIISEVHYEDVVFDLQERDVVLFHTDGAIEAQNEAGKLYGFDRLGAVSGRAEPSETTAETWLDGILEDVYRFSGPAPQHDDMTFVVLKVGT
ncbi:MAG: SpoIIE family protein phosphatase, partial [Candidatus Latescibacteria bacterium]|nr:SpoIIE family protein phosphatase [Candidatus Latescibacterota bacterium]